MDVNGSQYEFRLLVESHVELQKSPTKFHRRNLAQMRPHWYSAGREHASVFSPYKPCSFGWGEWHLSGFFTVRSCCQVVPVSSIFVCTFSTCCGTFRNSVRFFSQSPTQFAQMWQIQYFIPLSVLVERFCVDWHPDQHDGTTRLRAMDALSWLSSRFRS